LNKLTALSKESLIDPEDAWVVAGNHHGNMY
jgi:uncharacterized membrane protein